jgi:hypothetical protein
MSSFASPSRFTKLPTSTSPLLYQALSVTQSLRDDRDRDSKEDEISVQVNRQLNTPSPKNLSRSSNSVSSTTSASSASRLLDEVLQKAHEVRNLQERELLVNTPNTPGRGSAVVDSLLTSMAKERDEAKQDFSSANETVHRLRLQLSDVSHKLAASVGEVERLKGTIRSKEVMIENISRTSRNHEREDIITRAELSTQRGEVEKLRQETNTLRQTTRDLIEELERSKSKTAELSLRNEAYEQKERDLRDRVDASQRESSSLRDSLALITKDCDVQRSTAEQKTKEMEHLIKENDSVREKLEKEKQERAETENVLKDLMEQAQELRHSRDKDRKGLIASEAVTSMKINEYEQKIIKMEQMLMDAKNRIEKELNARINLEKAYNQLEKVRDRENMERKVQREQNTNQLNEINMLNNHKIENEKLKVTINELKHDKTDLKALLTESQEYLVVAKEEFEAKILSEERMWKNRLQNEKSEISRLEDIVLTMKKKSENDIKELNVLNERTKDQKINLIRMEEKNNVLKTGNETNESIINTLKNKIVQLQNAGRDSLVLARSESKKNINLKKEMEGERERLRDLYSSRIKKYEEKLEKLSIVEVEFKMAEVSNKELVRKLTVANDTIVNLENNVNELSTTNASMVRELEGMRQSYSDFLNLSRKSVRDIKRGGTSEKGSGINVTF